MKDLIILCENFVNDHPMEDALSLDGFDAQEFFEGVEEEDLIEFFRELYVIMANGA